MLYKISSLFFILLIVVLAFALSGSLVLLVPDEARYAEIAREMFASHNYITPYLNGTVFLDKPPLFYWITSISYHIFGVNNYSARSFPFFMNIIFVLFSFSYIQRLHSLKVAFFTLFMLETSLLFFALSQYANMDFGLAVLESLCLLSFLVHYDANYKSKQHNLRSLWFGRLFKRGNYLSMYVWAALAFLTKGVMAVLFPAAIIGLWIIFSNNFKNLKYMNIGIGIIIFLIIVMPWLILCQLQNQEFFYYFFYIQQFFRYISVADFNNKQPFYFYIPIILVGMLPWTLLIFTAIHSIIKRRAKEISFYVIWFVFILLFFSIPSSKIVSYILPLLLPVFILISMELAKLNKLFSWNAFLMGILAVIGTVVFLLYANGLPMASKFNLGNLIDKTSFDFLIIIILISILILFVVSFVKMKIAVKFVLVGICALFFMISLKFYYVDMYYQNSKTTVAFMKKNIDKDTKIIMYNYYYFDIPFYLQRTVGIYSNWQNLNTNKDNWKRELQEGIIYKDGFRQKNLMDFDQLRELWQSSTNLLLLLPYYYLDEVKSIFPNSIIIYADKDKYIMKKVQINETE